MGNRTKNRVGWFDFADFYDYIVSRFDDAVFVEIGTWKGASIKYLAQEVRDTGKNIRLYGVDTFKGTTGEPTQQMDEAVLKDVLYETYLKNIESVKAYVTTIIGDSHEVHKRFEERSLDVVFIDGDHSYEALLLDLAGWYPKVKQGGIIAGHDYYENFCSDTCGVAKAVNEFFFDEEISRFGKSVWYYEKRV